MNFGSFVILMFYLPWKTTAENIQYVYFGANVKLQCKIQSNVQNYPTSYEWYDQNNNYLGNNINLEILKFSEKNQGRYTCKASQTIGNQRVTNEKSIDVRLNSGTGFQSGTQTEIQIPPEYKGFYTGILFLLCKTSKNNDQYKYEWITPNGTIHAKDIIFKNYLTMEDAGLYTCRVTRLSDNSVSENHTYVNINSIPMKIEKRFEPLGKGENVTLRCELDNIKTLNKIYTKFTYQWEDPMGRKVGDDQNLNIRLDNNQAFGKYKCRISSIGVNPGYEQYMEIEIRSNQNEQISSTYSPSLIANPDTPRYGNPLELRCSTNPPLSEASYVIIFNNKTLTTSGYYRFDKLKTTDFGTYSCEIKGRDVNTGLQVNLKIDYIISVYFQRNQKIDLTKYPGPQIFAQIGDKKELHCEINPSLRVNGKDVVWYFNEKEISENDLPRYNIEFLNKLYVSIIIIPSINSINEGKYECKIKGETKEVYVLIAKKKRFIEVNPPNQIRRTNDGNPVEFHCRISAYETKNRQLIWTFISRETGQESKLEQDYRWSRSDDPLADETSFVVIQQAEMKDSGIYRCTEPVTLDSASGVLNVYSDLRIVITPPIIRLRVGQTARFQCYVKDGGRSPEYPEFFMANGGRAADSQRTAIERVAPGKVQLTYRDVTTYDNGTKFTCRQGRSTADVLLLVEPVCSAGFRLCRNGECINSAKFCDGKPDCNDKSDEDPVFCRQCDPLSKICEIHNGQAPKNPIYQAHWSCDGEDDCGNGFDESKCSGHVLECGGLLYRCKDGKNIPKAFLCDKEKDCADGDDENRCYSPTIISEPMSSYTVNSRKGDTVVLTCQATGFPLPRIIWRFNWNCITDEQRMTVYQSNKNCDTTIGTLTITNFQPGDDGIYNCEALSNTQRAWSKDYHLMMNFRN